MLHSPCGDCGVLDLAVGVAGRPGVVAEGAVRLACHLVGRRQVARGRRLVHDDRVDRPAGHSLLAVSTLCGMMHELGGAVNPLTYTELH